MNDKPQFADDNIRRVRELPAEQFAAARQIILLGGNVWLNHRTGKVPAESVSFQGERFTDAAVPLLWPFRNTPIRGIGFVRTKVTDDGIAQAFQSFPTLKSITVFEMPVGDAALAPLERFNDLEHVSLGQTQITSASLRHFAHQSSLAHISISETAVDDAGLKHLEGLSQLKWLSLGNTKITSAGLVSIGKIDSLEKFLGLNDTPVDDEGLKYLVSLQKLETLGLDGTRITNAGMVHLARLFSLKELYVGRTKVDAEGLALLQNMPKLEEVRWVDHEKATLEQKRFHARFILYLPANANRWKDAREKFERGELEIK